MTPEIVITGFPKCGTTALIRAFEVDPEIQLLKQVDGNVELAWPLIKTMDISPRDSKILAHKFTVYVYNQEALKYLADSNPDSVIVLCIRDPKKSLISWRRMHQVIARTEQNKQHFAYRERDFYANCSIPDYYERFARRRLEYDKHFKSLLAIIPKERIIVVSQERMAQDMDAVEGWIKSMAKRGGGIVASPSASKKDSYKGYADKTDTVLDEGIRQALDKVQNRLYEMIKKSGVHSCI